MGYEDQVERSEISVQPSEVTRRNWISLSRIPNPVSRIQPQITLIITD